MWVITCSTEFYTPWPNYLITFLVLPLVITLDLFFNVRYYITVIYFPFNKSFVSGSKILFTDIFIYNDHTKPTATIVNPLPSTLYSRVLFFLLTKRSFHLFPFQVFKPLNVTTLHGRDWIIYLLVYLFRKLLFSDSIWLETVFLIQFS